MFSPGWFSRSLALINVIQLFVRGKCEMGNDPDVSRCLFRVKLPFIAPFAAPHQMAVSNRSTYWWVYTSIQKKIPPPCYPQIIPNLKYIPQSCSKEWFLHLFDYHWECHDTLVIVQDVQGTIKENRCISIQAFALFPRNLTRGILVLDGQLAEPKSLKMGWGWNEGSVY